MLLLEVLLFRVETLARVWTSHWMDRSIIIMFTKKTISKSVNSIERSNT